MKKIKRGIYMKKNLLLLGLFVFCFMACSNSSNPDSTKRDIPTIDMRTKHNGVVVNLTDTSVSRSVSNNPMLRENVEKLEFGKPLEFTIKSFDDSIYGGLNKELTESFLKVYDSEFGVRLSIEIPRQLIRDNGVHAANLKRLQVIYIDNNGHYSTHQLVDVRKIYNYDDDVVNVHSWEFPFVEPGKLTKLIIQSDFDTLDYVDEDKNTTEGEARYQKEIIFTPEHGVGVVDDLPIGYNSTDYIRYEDNKLIMQNVIPPEITPLVRTGNIWETNDNVPWGPTNSYIRYLRFNVLEGEDPLVMNLPEFKNQITKKNVFFQFSLVYTYKNFDYCEFTTITFDSDLIPANKL